MQFALFAGLSFIPGFFWLWFYIRLNKVRPSPKRWVALTFLLGMVWSIPAGIINTATLPVCQAARLGVVVHSDLS